MIYLLARNHHEAEWWCTHQDPPIRQREVVILVGETRKLRGRRLVDGDRIVEYHGGPQRPEDIYRDLSIMCRYAEKRLEDIIEYVWSV